MIDQATQEAIAALLQVGQARGYAAHQIAYGVPEDDFPGIEGLFDQTWPHRAETIAFNELANAQHVSSLNRFAATGMVGGVQLVENTDTDEPCASRNGQIVPLSSNPERLHVNCRLGLVPVLADEP
jgi:hypothetical protein